MKPIKRALPAILLLLFAAPAAGSIASPSRPPRPPQEAYEACEDKSEGDSCTFVGRNDETVDGTCREDRRDNTRLLCIPNDRPRPPRD